MSYDYYQDESIGGLCATCNHTEGPYWSDICLIYNMPFSMVHRKKKCKHYERWVYKP